jgi:hypothetical protein
MDDFTQEDQAKLNQALGAIEQAQVLQNQIYQLTDLCFSKCIAKVRQPDDKNDMICINNCAERFLDATQVIMKNFPAFTNK